MIYLVIEMNNIKYDEAKINEMQAFLNYIMIIQNSNPDLIMNSNLIYRDYVIGI